MAGRAATIDERIAAQQGDLTPTEQRLAAMLTDDPTRWAFATVAEVAEQADTSGPTVVRFAVALGFVGFGELQDQVRSDVTEQLRRPSDRLRNAPSGVDHTRAIEAIATTFDRLDDERVEAIARTLATARGHVWIIASESSSPVAHLLATNLGLLRPGIVHLTGSGPTTAAALVDASARDAAIAIDFPRYELAVVDVASALAQQGVAVTALTDGPLSPLANIARDWCGVTVPSVGPFDSAAPTIAVAEVVIARVAARLGSAATRRLDAVEQRWADDQVFVSTTSPAAGSSTASTFATASSSSPSSSSSTSAKRGRR